MAKLLALFVLIHLVWIGLPDPFLPFLLVFDYFRHFPFSWILRVAALIGSAAVLFNYRVRAACVIVGLAVLLGILSSRLYFQNNKLYLGCLLVLLGLYEPQIGPWLIRSQVVLVFFAAALNKLLDPTWRHGQFFDYWANVMFIQSWYFRLGSRFSDTTILPLIMSWLTIATEFSISVGLMFRRYRAHAIWLGLLFFAALNLMTGQTFGFFYLAPISFIAFAPWPRSTVTVLYDGDCGFCNQTRRVMERLDLEALFAWEPFQTARCLHGIPEQALQRRLYVVIGNNKYSGFAAFKIMFLYNPLTYFVLLLALSPAHLFFYPRYQRYWLVVALLLFFAPIFAPVGEMFYDLIARNRHYISQFTGGISCGVTAERAQMNDTPNENCHGFVKRANIIRSGDDFEV